MKEVLSAVRLQARRALTMHNHILPAPLAPASAFQGPVEGGRCYRLRLHEAQSKNASNR